MDIHRLLCSSCCFLNTNIEIIRQRIGTARMLKAEWWQVLGAFGLLNFTVLWPVLAWRVL